MQNLIKDKKEKRKKKDVKEKKEDKGSSSSEKDVEKKMRKKKDAKKRRIKDHPDPPHHLRNYEAGHTYGGLKTYFFAKKCEENRKRKKCLIFYDSTKCQNRRKLYETKFFLVSSSIKKLVLSLEYAQKACFSIKT